VSSHIGTGMFLFRVGRGLHETSLYGRRLFLSDVTARVSGRRCESRARGSFVLH